MTMRYCDYHLHTGYSFDSKESIENICKKAVEYGIKEICLTDHVEFAAEDARDWPDFAKRDQEIKKCKEKYGDEIIILSGIESGQPQKRPAKEQELFSKQQFDFVIGSIHIVGNSGRPSAYLFNEDNYQNYFMDYFKESKELAEKCNYDVMGHVTFPFRYVPENLLETHPIESFKKEYFELFDLIIARDKGIEINTSGLRTSLKETMPNLQIVKWFKERGGRIVTIGSDGHSARSAFSGLEEGYQVLREAGFCEAARYQQRTPRFERLM